MDPNLQTSFIPKRPLAEDRVERPRTVSVFLFFSTVLLIASIVGAVFTYFYKTSLASQIEIMKGDLDKAEGAFEGDFIQELKTVDRRLNAASDVLSNHIIVSPIFDVLSKSTLKSIQFTKFGYTITGTGTAAQIKIQMSGKAGSYTSIALESDQLTLSKYIKDPVFSGLTLDNVGNVLFDLTFSVDPKLVLFGETLIKSGDTGTRRDIGELGDIDIEINSDDLEIDNSGNNGGPVSFPSGTQ